MEGEIALMCTPAFLISILRPQIITHLVTQERRAVFGRLMVLSCGQNENGKDFNHTVKPTHRNTTRRLPNFPHTHRGDILPFVVVAKKTLRANFSDHEGFTL